MQVRWLLVTCFVFVTNLSFAQKPQATSPDEKRTSAAIPTIKLTFVEEKDTPRVGASLVLYGPLGCSPDGAVFLETASPPDLQKRSLISIANHHDNNAATYFPLETLPDLHDARLGAYFATESMAVALVNGTRDDALSTSKRVTVDLATGERFEHDVKSGKHSDYVAIFDRQGNYKGSVELDLPFVARKIAAFDSGLLLMIGLDADHKTRFAFMNADGSQQRFLDTEESLLGSEKMAEATGLLKSSSPAFQANPYPNLGSARIVPFQDKLLLPGAA